MKSIIALFICFIGLACCAADGVVRNESWVEKMRIDQSVEGGTIPVAIDRFFSLWRSGDSTGIDKMLDRDLLAIDGFPNGRILKALPSDIPTEFRVLFVNIRARSYSERQGVWMIESIIEYSAKGSKKYAIWYFIRRGDDVYLRTIPFLKAPGNYLWSFDVTL